MGFSFRLIFRTKFRFNYPVIQKNICKTLYMDIQIQGARCKIEKGRPIFTGAEGFCRSRYLKIQISTATCSYVRKLK